MAIQNWDTYKFSEAEQDWDLERLFSDIEAKQLKKVTPAQQRNLKALLLGLSPKDVSPILNIEEKSLKPAFSALYRLIEDLNDQPERTVKHRNVPLVLARYRKGATISIDKKFDLLGRDTDRQKLEEFIKQYKIVLIKAGAGVGKSTLAREFLQTQFKKVIRIEMGLESGNVTPAEEKVSQILRKDFDEEPSRDFGINLDILREKLADRANPIGVLIDNLEPALDENYRFRENLRGYDALLAVLGDRDVFSFTLITSRRSLITPRARVNEYSLEGLNITAWRQYFHDCENGENSEALVQMCVAYNGNAKVMDILHGAIKNRFDGNIGAYWSRYQDALLADSELETLISVEMDWLQNNQSDAYKLLCRMGCYRYQDVKTIPFEGLICLLWDVPESRQSWVVDYLSKTSLIEVKCNYYLHPTIRELSKLRLVNNQKDWEIANSQAAEFWTINAKNTDNLEETLKAFEAYHHYASIKDYNLACEVIIKPRSSRFSSPLHYNGDLLGRALYRLGLFEKVISSINLILDNVDIEIHKSSLYNILGDTYWLTGKNFKAIECHKNSKHQLSLHLKKSTNKISLDSQKVRLIEQLNRSYFLNMGLCKLAVWELEEALNLFTELKNISKNTNFYHSILAANFCLAFTFSCLGVNDQASFHAELAHSQIDFKLGIWNGGYRFIFLGAAYTNINKMPKAVEMYSRAISFADDTQFTQVKGKALYGLAEINRECKTYEDAVSYNLEAIKLLKKIGAKCDLAEAYFQFGLTYQAMGEHDQVEEYKTKALELFAQMEAPKQIERVNKAFEQGAMK